MDRHQLSPVRWSRVLIVFVGLALLAVGPFPIIWRPWLSPDYAAKALVEDDGKGLTFWIPDAARFWGSRTYDPIFNYTNNFEDINRNPLIFTLIDMLSVDSPQDVSDVALKLLASHNINAQLLGCYVVERHALKLSSATSCPDTIRRVLIQNPDIYNQTEIVTALRVIERGRISGMAEVISRLINNKKAPYGIRVEACRAAVLIPERESLRNVVKNLDQYIKEGCNDAAAGQ